MNSLLVMEWNEKHPSLWDWENVFMFGAKVTENPKKLQPTDWSVEGERGMNSESFYSPGGDGGSGVSGSDLGDGTSKSSKSGSVNSSVGESKKSNFSLEAFEGFPKDFVDKKQSAREAEALGSSPTHEISAGSGEPLLSLKLGKRMYFEDVCAGNNAKTSAVSVISTPMGTKAKRFKSIGQSTAATRCQVEGCNIDLSSAKDYHRKHRICANHSKSPKVVVNGVERRFCQQCSRFHGLSEFDEKKRSCRRRLSDHNARRRKPLPGALRDRARLSSSLYSTDGRQDMSLVLDQAPCVYSRNATNLSWDGACSFRLTPTKDYFPNPAKGGGTSRQLNLAENRTSSSLTMLYQDSSRLPPSKGTASQVLNRGAEESMISFNLDAPQNLNRALSLLSTSSWASCEAKPVSLDNTNHSYHTNMPRPVMQAMNQGLPLSSEYWQNEQPSLDTTQVNVSHSQSNGSNQYQDLHLFKGPYEFGYNTNQFN
ncbi:squamosa promoter-binding-like protein 2 [Rosa rugosa]|uniref:squamosa promoter-binding-like protein 2 n=1 Tax=Rosa rugosa TaxID=74645 RepID=UPI002B4040D7|nr:squamosa promoter-binding-like protein 2 [Rosa rugosa]XP_061989381.1 squamosa promoter-binding-like protein 2 [Rosa rugosa]XP_061989382.1 squamosa promoter-binding-like protein 2 [Rosa rugosa]XP_061989383.1 squamosa promoter-binding-like protein 2 [Rosa rugosa]